LQECFIDVAGLQQICRKRLTFYFFKFYFILVQRGPGLRFRTLNCHSPSQETSCLLYRQNIYHLFKRASLWF